MNGRSVKRLHEMASADTDDAGATDSGSGIGLPAGVIDLGLVAIGTVAVLAEALGRADPGVSAFAFLLVVLPCAPLALRRRWPLVSLIASSSGALLCAAVLHTGWSVTAVVAVALYTFSLRGDRRQSLVVGLITAVLVSAAVLVIDGQADIGAIVARVALVFVCVAAGDVIRSRQELAQARRLEVELEKRDREEQLSRRAAAERMQIARELHDILAHSLVAINVRASVALDVHSDPEAALNDIKHASAAALRDLRSTISVLRDADSQAPTAPTPDLSALQRLTDNARAAGLEVEVEIDLASRTLPAATAAAAVRIVQESLTNVIRHAGAQHVQVAISAKATNLEVAVTDDGHSEPHPDDHGFGIRGMSERATALGGRLTAGRSASGRGWTVQASLPLGSDDR
jgi:signal transduction histidine kinase